MNIRSSRAALLVIVTSLLTSLVQAASPPGTTILPPIDLSPGDDVPSPAFFALNRSTHKLYVTGNPSFGLKVIDTTTNKITGGFTFGSYPGARSLLGLAMAVDESPGPDGNKVYVVGKPSNSYVLRIIDGVTDKELTAGGLISFSRWSNCRSSPASKSSSIQRITKFISQIMRARSWWSTE